ncbi:MAG: hypothetical protein HUJ69_01600, partial [Lachnospiraceae bacterium]|nr:hypothetical protein [Lachnospiraceae bacterium]
PTEKGKQLIAVVPVELRSPEMTGKWERSLERIYRGSMDPTRFKGSIERYVRYIVESAATPDPNVKFEREDRKRRSSGSGSGTGDKASGGAAPLGTCPICKKGEVRKNSKAYYCTSWKEGCRFTVWLDALDRYGAHVEDDLMRKLLVESGQETMELTLPQTGEKGTGCVYLSKEGKLEIKDFKRDSEKFPNEERSDS